MANRKAVGGGLWTDKRRSAVRRRRESVATRFEALEPRALLAITGLPAVGDQFGAPIVLATNGAGPNPLTIVLDDVTNPGRVTATIDGNAYFNFGNTISFTGTFDTDGSIDNAVTIITPFGVDLGNGSNQFQWNSTCDFTPAGLPDIKVNLIDADELTIQTTSSTVGGPSTIVGTFHSPTLAPPPGATIDFQSSGVITVLALGVNTYDLALTTTANGVPSAVVFAGPVSVKSALAVASKGDLVIDQPLTAITGGSITLTSTAGLIDVNKAVTADAAVTMTANQGLTVDALVTSLTAGITLSAGTLLEVNDNLTADTGVTLTGVTGIRTDAAADVVSATGNLALTSASGFVRAAGDLVATAGSVGVTAGKLDVETAVVTALTGLTVAANTDATLGGPTTVTGIGGVTVTADNKVSFTGTTTLLGLGDVDATATAGNLVVAPLAAIKVTDGTTDLQSVSGTVTIESQVVGNQTITIQAAQGIVLSNLADPAAEVKATGPLFNVVITNDANQILIDAPVSALGGDVAITAKIDDVVIRDDLYGLDNVTVAANTTLLVDGVAPGTVSVKADTGTLGLSSTTSSVTLGPNVVVGTGLGAAAGVTLTAATVVNLDVPVVANGAIAITSPDTFTVLDPLTSNLAGIAITAANGPVTSVLAPLTAGTAITITALNNVTLDNTLTSTGAGISVTSTAGIVTTQTGCVLSAPSLVAGAIAITAGTFVMGNHITAGHDLTVQTATSFVPVKNVTSNGGDVTIDVTGGVLDVSGSTITAPLGSVTLSAAGAVTYGTVTTGPAGSFSVTGGGIVTPLGPISVGGSITISTGSTFIPSVGDNLSALTGSISVTAAGTVDVTDIFLNAPLGSVSLTSKTGNVEVGIAPNLITVSLVSGSITLAAPMGSVLVGQALTAGAKIDISSLNSYTAGFALTAGDSISIQTTGAGGFIDVSDPAAVLTPVAGDLTLDSFADAVKLNVLNPLLSSGGSVTVSSALDLDVVATVTAVVGSVTLKSTAGDVFVKSDLFAGPVVGTLTIEAAGEINDGTANGPVTNSVKAANFVAAAGPLAAVFPKFQFTNPLNAIGDLALTLTKGDGVDFVNSGTFTVSALDNDTGTVSLVSLAGGLTVAAAIGSGTTEALEGITLTAPAGITVTGAGGLWTKTGPGDIILTSTSGGITIDGPVNADPPTAEFKASAGMGVAVTGSIFAATDVTVDAGTAISLGGAGSTITANTGSVSVASIGAGGIKVEADVFALSGSIDIKTLGTLNFTGGSLTAATPYIAGMPAIGLVRLDSGATTITGAPVVTAGRFEVYSLGATPQTFTGANQVDSLRVDTAGSFEFNNFSGMLSITDFDPTTPSVQISTGGDLTIRQQMAGVGGGRFRVIDGIECGGVLTLSADESPLGVEFVASSTGDNPSPPPFAGTVRDMLSLINQNSATLANAPNAVMTAVFDEPGTPVSLGGTVSLTATLPAITKRITFDGSLLPAKAGESIGGIVGLDGTLITVPSATGLSLATGSAGTVLRNTAIHGFLGTGVAVATADNHLTGLLVGLDRSGGADGNGVGIDVAGTAADRNVIGVEIPGDAGNRVAANTSTGVRIGAGADYTQVYGNVIGLDGAGAAAGNGLHGVSVNAAIGTRIGSATAAFANLIANSTKHGVLASDVVGSSIEYGVQVIGNTIEDNGLAGVQIRGGRRNLVGGFLIGEENVIQGNRDGVWLTPSLAGPTSGNHVVGNAIDGNSRDGVRLDAGSFGNRISANAIDNNSSAGIRITNSAVSRTQPTNRVFSNTITGNGGTALDGGIVLDKSAGQMVGTTMTGGAAGNTVSLNLGSGIVVIGSAPLAASSNVIAFNTVNDNGFDGIRVQGGIGNVVRANFVTANLQNGIAIVDALAATTAQGNAVTNNAVGGNGFGIVVEGGARNVIGGDLPALGNRVFSSLADGIVVRSSTGTGHALGTVIRNNGIGLDAGNAAAGNGGYGIRLTDSINTLVDFGNLVRDNSAGGIVVNNGLGITIGSAVAGRGNVVSNNGGPGILVESLAPARIQALSIIGNTIDSNAGFGIRVTGGSTAGVTIGRIPSVTLPNGTGNTIRFNTGGGVQVDAAQAVTIIGNQTINNSGPEIDLVNGANQGIAAPVLTSVKPRVAGQRTPQYDCRGSVTGVAGTRRYVDFYGVSPLGQQFYLGRVLVTIGANGIGNFRKIVNGGPGGVTSVQATATDASSLFGGTSEFSPSVAV